LIAKAPAFTRFLFHQDDHAGQVAGEHVGLVSGLFAVEQHLLAIAHDPRGRLRGLAQRKPPFPPKRRGLAFVTAAQDGDFAPAVAQSPGKFFHDRGLARPAHREIAHDHDQTAKGLIVQDPMPVKPEPCLRSQAEKIGQDLQKRSVNRCAGILPAPQNHVDRVKLERVDFLLEPGRHEVRSNED